MTEPYVPDAATTTTLVHEVAFFETDAMGVVHHANYLRFFELARVRWLDEHDRPYPEYVDQGIHLAVTRAQVDYHQSARFADSLAITTWLAWVRGASLCMEYHLAVGEVGVVTGATEHAAVDTEGHVRRIPRATRDRLRALALHEAPVG